MSRRSASPRRTGLSPTGTIPDIPAATSIAEKNGVFSSSTPDMRRPAGVEPRTQRRGDRGTVLQVIAPAGERVLEVDTAIVDLGQRRQQLGDRQVIGEFHCA